MLILDNPGAREDREGNPFLCGTRETLQLGMKEAGMDINSVYVTYLLKRRPIRAYDKPATRAACLPHLQSQLLQKRPLVLFGFGNVVVEGLFPEKENATVKEPRGSWHEFQGIPISFTYHPLAVRRRPNLLRFFIEDLKGLREKWEERARGKHKEERTHPAFTPYAAALFHQGLHKMLLEPLGVDAGADIDIRLVGTTRTQIGNGSAIGVDAFQIDLEHHRLDLNQGRVDRHGYRQWIMQGTAGPVAIGFLVAFNIVGSHVGQEAGQVRIQVSPVLNILQTELGLHGHIQSDQRNRSSRLEDELGRLRIGAYIRFRMHLAVARHAHGSAHHDNLTYQRRYLRRLQNGRGKIGQRADADQRYLPRIPPDLIHHKGAGRRGDRFSRRIGECQVAESILAMKLDGIRLHRGMEQGAASPWQQESRRQAAPIHGAYFVWHAPPVRFRNKSLFQGYREPKTGQRRQSPTRRQRPYPHPIRFDASIMLLPLTVMTAPFEYNAAGMPLHGPACRQRHWSVTADV